MQLYKALMYCPAQQALYKVLATYVAYVLIANDGSQQVQISATSVARYIQNYLHSKSDILNLLAL